MRYGFWFNLLSGWVLSIFVPVSGWGRRRELSACTVQSFHHVTHRTNLVCLLKGGIQISREFQNEALRRNSERNRAKITGG
jgi:hypothetical protein